MRGENRRLQARLNNVISLDTMKKALEEKDKALADAQKVAKEKTQTAEKKLAAVAKVEEENNKLKQERANWSKSMKELTKKAKGLEEFFGNFSTKMYGFLEGNLPQSSELCQFSGSSIVTNSFLLPRAEFCQDFQKETDELEPNLDPTKSPVGDVVAIFSREY